MWRPHSVLVWNSPPTMKIAPAMITGFGIPMPGKRPWPISLNPPVQPLASFPSLTTKVRPRTATKNPKVTMIGAKRPSVAREPCAAPTTAATATAVVQATTGSTPSFELLSQNNGAQAENGSDREVDVARHQQQGGRHRHDPDHGHL